MFRVWERRVRLWSGLIVAAFVIGHLLNHASSIVSVDLAEQTRRALAVFWHQRWAQALLYGSFIVHFIARCWRFSIVVEPCECQLGK